MQKNKVIFPMSDHSSADLEQTTVGKSLVVVSERDNRAGWRHAIPGIGCDAGFLAQLIACKTDVSAYRRHRREEPDVANQRYRTGLIIGDMREAHNVTTVAVA